MSKKKLRKPKRRKQKETKNSKRINIHSELKVEYFNAFPLLYQLGGIVMIAIGLFFLRDAFKNPYVDIGILSISLTFIFLAAACFYPLFKKRLYIFSSTKQQILLKKQGNTFIYPFEDVLGYCEYDQTYRDFGTKCLDIFILNLTIISVFSVNE